jgi:FlaG/FlaF family flagellin (archaellin)
MTATRARLAIAVILAALAMGLSGCISGGDDVNTQTNLANQRKAAIAFLETQGGVEQIRFTQAGGLSGFGAPWAVNAVVTVNGEEYNEILGTEPYSGAGNPLPSIAPGTEPARVTVIYSDASSEVIE